MSVHALTPSDIASEKQLARVDLAAGHRLAVFHDLEEGIDNHFTVTVPGTEDQYLVLPFGLHWSEAPHRHSKHHFQGLHLPHTTPEPGCRNRHPNI